MALAEMGLPLTDAKLLHRPHDEYGVRERVIARLTNEYAHDELQRLHQTALDEKSKRDFRAEVVGPNIRINEFVSSDAIRAMLGVVDEPGRPRRTLDLLDDMNQGRIHPQQRKVGERDADTSALPPIASGRAGQEIVGLGPDPDSRYEPLTVGQHQSLT